MRPEPATDRRSRGRIRWTHYLWLLLLPVLPALLMAWLHPRAPDWAGLRAGITRLTVTEAVRLDGVLWVDARSADHFAQGHIPGAINLSEDNWNAQLPDFIDQWTPGQPVIVYCDGEACMASRQVAMRIRRELELENVAVLTDGWPAWQEAHP